MSCPICNGETVQKYRPFCSRRCADIDLGKWLTGAYVLPDSGENDEEPEDGFSSPAKDDHLQH